MRMVGLPDMAAACRVKVQDYFFPEDQRFIAEEFFPRVLREGHGDVEIRLRHFQTGEPIWMFHYVFSLRDASGTPVGWGTLSRDITERKRAEEVRARLEAQLRQAQKLEAVGQLAGGIAHDFNNILAALMLNLGLLRQGAHLPPEVRAGLGEMAPLLQRAAALTKQLLLYARRGALQRRVLDLNAVVGDLFKMLERLIGAHIRLTFPSGETSLWIDADPGMIEQVVTNLVVNARDAMPDGGQIELGARRAEVDAAHVAANPEARLGSFICLAVRDTGSGMDEHTRRRIFEPFFTTKEVGKGTGLGLSTVQGIVQQHEGWIEVQSDVGQGSTFQVYLPSVEPPQATAAPEALPEALPGGNETILLVEDSAAVRAMAARVLEHRGYRVLQAGHGQEALKLWEMEGGKVDLVLTDVVMPEGLSGIELAERLQRSRPGLPVVLMTGYSAELMRRGFKVPPGARFLQKPFIARDLLRNIRQSLDHA
jgi:signal transduction histidine kinase/CheY-like chemotaxis protein